MTDAPPKYYLKFVSRVYDLAGDFDRQQLLDVQRIATKQKNKMIVTVASLLCELYTYREGRSDNNSNIEADVPSASEALRDILSSRAVFHSNKELLVFVRSFMDVSAVPKDSRERLVAKVLRGVDGMDDTAKVVFRNALEQRIHSGQDTPSFVERWSKLIREL